MVDYIGPEEAMGMELAARMDLLSLGKVLYQRLTGIRPFKGDTPALTFDAILNPTLTVNPNTEKNNNAAV
jgi:non-specific serine/threonine protein kinase